MNNTTVKLPKIIFGTSGLGNLFSEPSYEEKLAIVKACIEHSPNEVVFDSAGKYGAGLSLETLGKCLTDLQIPKEKVIISNKLGWLRAPLLTPEPTFEPGVWRNLQYDAVQKISYQGIMQCFEQGNQLLQSYAPQMLSVHDPDEYLAQATSTQHEAELYNDILEAYKALQELKLQGKIASIGVGAKNWKSIQRIANDVQLDWVMIANSITVHSHPTDLLNFVKELQLKGVFVINSAVFNGGFLVGSNYYNYKLVSPETHPHLCQWRDKFYNLCKAYNYKPATVCVQFAFKINGIKTIALNTTNANRVLENINMANAKIDDAFWADLYNQQFIQIKI